MTDTLKRIVLASRPDGAPTDDNFRLEDAPLPSPGADEVLIRVHYMSLDPYMRGRMDDAKSYAAPVPIGGTMEAGGVGEVIASQSPDFAVGDFVFGMMGWTTHAVMPAAELRKLDPKLAPPTTALGVLGMPGFTGWYGLNKLGRPKAGETLVVAAATGPVGSMVGQLAKAAGLRAVGIAGGADKCALATDTLGFDACIDHRAYDSASDLRAALADACPDGIDIYFENVGGKVFDAVFPLMNPHGRIPICGVVSWYNAGGKIDSEVPTPTLWRQTLVKFLSINGFIIMNHWDDYPEFLTEIAPKVVTGDIKFLEDVAEGIENAPTAFMGMLRGKNRGKQIVKLI
ncbi:MAG: NADP-dependent oxidoreductase [Marinibacterium sp.]|nr:NADP-dependent oxidoreductase [Marinibacterium sp.]